jgi:hypothetical protein
MTETTELTFDKAETYATAFTASQLKEAMAIFDRLRPSYPTIREAFIRAVELELLKVAAEINQNG